MLTVDEIKHFIDQDAISERKRLASLGQKYYEAEHDILNYRKFYFNTDGILVEDRHRNNAQICHPFFTELVDQLASYILSFDKNPIRAKDTVLGLQEHMDSYFDEEFWSEIQDLITGTNAKGFEYLYGYKDAEDKLTFRCADSLGVVEVRAQDTDTKCEHVIYWYLDRIEKGEKEIKRIQVYDDKEVQYFVQVDNGDIEPDKDAEMNPRPNVVYKNDKTGQMFRGTLGFVPFWRLDNCKKQFSGLKPIKALIDDYDLMECGLSNNLQDFDTPIYLVRGFEGDNLDELQQNIKTKKIMGVSDTGGLDILTVDIPYQARKTKADEDEKNIYRFGMGFNSAQAGDGNVTNVVIRSRYTLLELKARKLEKRLKRFLKDIIRVVLLEINEKNKTDYKVTDVEIRFEHNIPTNEAENVANEQVKAATEQVKINNVLTAASVIGDEETLKAICAIMDLDFEDLKGNLQAIQEEQNYNEAVNTLEGAMIDEQTAENSSRTISEQ